MDTLFDKNVVQLGPVMYCLMIRNVVLMLTLPSAEYTPFPRLISMTWVILGHAFAQAFQLASISGRSALPMFTLMR